MTTITLRYTKDDETGDMTVFFDNHAELFAFCVSAEDEYSEDGTVTLSGLCEDETPLLRQAVNAAARGKGRHVVMRANGTADVDG